MESHGSNVRVKNKLIGPDASVVFGSRRSATLRCGWKSGVTCTREATNGDVYAEGGARDPSIKITRVEAKGGCSSRLLETSQVQRATAGSKFLPQRERVTSWPSDPTHDNPCKACQVR